MVCEIDRHGQIEIGTRRGREAWRTAGVDMLILVEEDIEVVSLEWDGARGRGI